MILWVLNIREDFSINIKSTFPNTYEVTRDGSECSYLQTVLFDLQSLSRHGFDLRGTFKQLALYRGSVCLKHTIPGPPLFFNIGKQVIALYLVPGGLLNLHSCCRGSYRIHWQESRVCRGACVA